MAREVDPKMEHGVAVFGLEANTEIELWWEKMRGVVRAYQKAKIVEVVNSNVGGKSGTKDQGDRDDNPASPKRLVSPPSPCYAHQHWIPDNFISIYLQLTHQYSHAWQLDRDCESLEATKGQC